MHRFAAKGELLDEPNALASLALLRALTAVLIRKQVITEGDMLEIKQLALDELPDNRTKSSTEARQLVSLAFP
jgi:hypothetical protein